MKSGKVIDLRAGKRPEPERRRASAPAPHHRDRKISPIRVRRRKIRLYLALGAIVLLASMVYVVHWISYMPRLSIAAIEVKGAQQLEPSLVRAYADSVVDDGSYHYFSRSNILLYPREALEKGIVDSFPRLNTAAVSRDGLLGQILTITVTERTPFGMWCKSLDQAECFAMDERGYIFTVATSSDTVRYAQPYLFTGGVASTSASVIGQIFAPGHVPGILALLRLLSQSGDLTPTSVSVQDDQDFSVRFTQGFILKASYGGNPSTLSRNIRLVLGSDALKGKASELEYIDLRFGNRVYYKLKGAEQVSAE